MSKLWVLIIKIVVAVLMVAAIVVLAVCLHKKGEENRRIKSNYEAEIRKDYAQQQVIDLKELKQYFNKELQVLKEQGIAAKNVENIVNVSYVYRDTTLYRDTLVYVYDTVRKAHTADFSVHTDCFDIEGQVVDDTLEIGRFEARDTVLVALYKEKRKCLFEKRRIRAIAISGCSGDTLSILRNLKVGK